MHLHTAITRRAAGLLLLSIPAVALAGGPPPPQPEISPQVEHFGPVVDPVALSQLRGGTSVENQVDANGIVEGNHAENITTGDNTLAGGAFGNATGINTVIQNSGSNVLIQNGMVVNVQFTPTP